MGTSSGADRILNGRAGRSAVTGPAAALRRCTVERWARARRRHHLRPQIGHAARERPGLSQSNTPEVPPAPVEQAVAERCAIRPRRHHSTLLSPPPLRARRVLPVERYGHTELLEDAGTEAHHRSARVMKGIAALRRAVGLAAVLGHCSVRDGGARLYARSSSCYPSASRVSRSSSEILRSRLPFSCRRRLSSVILNSCFILLSRSCTSSCFISSMCW
jgi:hypothetical protein